MLRWWRWAVDLAERLAVQVATSQEAREILGLKKPYFLRIYHSPRE